MCGRPPSVLGYKYTRVYRACTVFCAKAFKYEMLDVGFYPPSSNLSRELLPSFFLSYLLSRIHRRLCCREMLLKN